MEVIEKWNCCPFVPLYEYRKMADGQLDTQNENYPIDVKKSERLLTLRSMREIERPPPTPRSLSLQSFNLPPAPYLPRAGKKPGETMGLGTRQLLKWETRDMGGGRYTGDYYKLLPTFVQVFLVLGHYGTAQHFHKAKTRCQEEANI